MNILRHTKIFLVAFWKYHRQGRGWRYRFSDLWRSERLNARSYNLLCYPEGRSNTYFPLRIKGYPKKGMRLYDKRGDQTVYARITRVYPSSDPGYDFICRVVVEDYFKQ